LKYFFKVFYTALSESHQNNQRDTYYL